MRATFTQLFVVTLLINGCASKPLDPGKLLSSAYLYNESGDKKLSCLEYEFKGFARYVVDNEEVVGIDKKFKRIHPISDERAVVDQGSGKLAFYDIDDDELTPIKDTTFEYAPPVQVGRTFEERISIAMTHSGASPGDVTVYLPRSAKPRVFKNLGGEAVLARKRGDAERFAGPYAPTFGNQSVVNFRDFFVVHSLAEDRKTPVSQMISLSGEPLGPRVGYIYRAVIGEDIVPLSEVGDIPGAYFSGQKLYWPLGSDGKFLPLPENALGVLQVRDMQNFPVAWLIMFPDDKGLVGAVHWGKITDIPKTIVTAPRVIDAVMPEIYLPGVSYNWNFAYQGYDGKWFFDPRSTTRATSYGVGSQYLPTRDAFLAYVKLRNDQMKDLDKAESAARFKAWEDSTRAAREAEFNQLNRIRGELADGAQLCNRFQDAVRLGKETVATYLAKCEVNDEYVFKVAEGMGIGTQHYRQQRDQRAAQAQFQREEERARAAARGGGGLLKHLESQNGPGISAAPAGAGYDAGKGSFGAQQQRYQWQKQLNQQLYNRPYDPYK